MDSPLNNLEMPRPSATFTDRLRYLIKLSHLNQAGFAKAVGIDPANLSRILTGKQEAGESFINRVVVNLGVSKEWLVSGNDVPFPRSVSARAENSGALPARPAGAPVYDIDVIAGTRSLSRMFTDEHVIGFCNLPGVNPENPLIRVSGNSMMPKIRPGAFISIRPVPLDAPVSWGQIYVVVLEDFRLVKYVRRHHDPDMLILHSDNPDYDDMEIRRSDIVALYLVESILNYEVVC